MFTRVSYDDTGYKSSLVKMPSQTCTGKRFLPIRHWVTMDFLTPFLCVLNVGDTLSVRCRHPLLCVSSIRFP